jgi:hypothetical protein
MRALFLNTILLLGLAAFAQDNAQSPKLPFISSPRRLLTAPELPDAPDEWIDRSFQWVNYILREFPPAREEVPVRRAALIRLAIFCISNRRRES